VEVQWRSPFRSTSLDKWCTSYNAPATFRKPAADCWPLRNFLPGSSFIVVGKAQKWHGARSGLYGGCSNRVPPIHFFQAEHRIQFTFRSMRFLGFSKHVKGAPRQEISKWSTVCSTFSRSGWSVVRSASLAKGGTLLPYLWYFEYVLCPALFVITASLLWFINWVVQTGLNAGEIMHNRNWFK
jgi:hypothetical protein